MAETDTGIGSSVANDTGSSLLNELAPDPGPNINNAGMEMLFESLFANTASRETISIRDWLDGWAAIVGGINGIPTSRQFNTLQYITDLKCRHLYRDVAALKIAGAAGVKIGTIEELNGKNMVLLETLKDTNRIYKVHRTDSENKPYEYEFASVFEAAAEREKLESGDSLPELFGKIAKYLDDIKASCFKDADDPFVLMTEATYKPPAKRTKGSLYGLITKIRGLIVIQFDRYIQGLEEPRVERTMYGVEITARADVEESPYSYAGVLNCIVFLDGSEDEAYVREPEKLYAVVKESR